MPRVEFEVQTIGGKFTKTVASYKRDLRTGLNREPLWIGCTESGQDEKKQAFVDECEKAGYHPYAPRQGDTVCAVRGDARVLATANVFGNPAQRGKASQGGHGPRYITVIKFLWMGSRFSMGEGHWITGRNRRGLRLRQHVAMTDVALGTMELGSRNRGISLLAGDFNEADRRDNSAGTAVKLKKVGAVTCWDEVGKWPDTHDGGPSTAIDWIVRLKRDRRMKFLDAGTIELESDHDLAWARCGLWVPRRALR